METRLKLTVGRELPVEIPQGYYMCFSFTTQAANKVYIKLYDETTVYLDEERQSTEPAPMVTGDGYVQGEAMRLKLDIPASSNIEIRKNSWDITGPGGEVIARTMVFLVEDYIDYDYNDVILTITAWKEKG